MFRTTHPQARRLAKAEAAKADKAAAVANTAKPGRTSGAKAKVSEARDGSMGLGTVQC